MIGSMVYNARGEELYVPLELNLWGGVPRMSFRGHELGLVINIEEYWAETWYQVILPDGIGWVKEIWVEVVE